MAAAGAAAGQIKTRDFIQGDNDTNLKKLRFKDMKHDFKARITVDRPYHKRGQDGVNFFPGFLTTIVRKVMGLDPTYSYEYNGCSPGYADPEDFGLNEAVRVMRPTVIEVKYPKKAERTVANVNAVYARIADELNSYKVNVGGEAKVPLVIDFQYQLLDHSADQYNLKDKVVICRNREHYTDPGRTSRLNFNGVRILEEIDNGSARTYESAITGLPGELEISGSVTGDCKIVYGGVEWNETYNKDMKIYPNTISMCMMTVNSLIKQNTLPGQFLKGVGDESAYCSTFKGGKDDPNVNKTIKETEVYIKRIAAQFMKKRLADQLQAASCKKPISYSYGASTISIGGAKPCVFWSHDRLAVAFAILQGIPCILEHGENTSGKGAGATVIPGKLMIFLPQPAPAKPAAAEEAPKRGVKRGRNNGENAVPDGKREKGNAAEGGGGGVQVGGACTRAGLEGTLKNTSTNSAELLKYIRQNPDCKSMILTSLMEFKVNEDGDLVINPYLDFSVLQRFILYRLAQEGKVWNGFPNDEQKILPHNDGRYYVDAADKTRLNADSNILYANGGYHIKYDTPRTYKLVQPDRGDIIIDIVGDVHTFIPEEGYFVGGGSPRRSRSASKRGPRRDLYRALHNYASLVRQTEQEFALFEESGEQFLPSAAEGYHARDLFFFLQGLMMIGKFLCEKDEASPMLFQELLVHVPGFLEKNGYTALLERYRSYLDTITDTPFQSKKGGDIPETIKLFLETLVKQTHKVAYSYNVAAPFGGISAAATEFLAALDAWKEEGQRIKSPLVNVPLKMGKQELLSAYGGARRRKGATRRAAGRPADRRSTRRAADRRA